MNKSQENKWEVIISLEENWSTKYIQIPLIINRIYLYKHIIELSITKCKPLDLCKLTLGMKKALKVSKIQ